MKIMKKDIKKLIESKRLVIEGDYIIKNGVINVIGNVKLRGLEHIPIKFGVIDGNFNCSFCGLLSFDNAPHTVTGNVDAQANKFINLRNCPKNIGKNLVLNGNRVLSNLQGCPETINGTLDLYGCNISSLQGISKKITKNLMLGKNMITGLSSFPDSVGGSVDITDNYIVDISDDIIKKVKGDINSDGNPCNAADGIEENRLW